MWQRDPITLNSDSPPTSNRTLLSRSPFNTTMTSLPTSQPSPTLPSVQEWKKIIADYTRPSAGRAIWQLVNTFVPFVGLWVLMAWSLSGPYWITLLLATLAALLTVRVFIIFHDCGHGSFFKSKRANDIVGFFTGMLTFTPYVHWRWEHAIHHASCGDLDRRGTGDIWTMTISEYLAAPKWKRLVYRLVRNPIMLFVLAPLVVFVGYQRFSNKTATWRERKSVYAMNVALALMVGLGCWLLGWKGYLAIQLPITMISGSLGIWMFYVQHQFEDVYWEEHGEWDFTSAALLGSSFYKLPKILQWFTGNIGFHHIHHLSPRIPNYLLEACHKSHEIFTSVQPITFWSSLKTIGHRFYDEGQKKLVGYKRLREVRREMRHAAALERTAQSHST